MEAVISIDADELARDLFSSFGGNKPRRVRTNVLLHCNENDDALSDEKILGSNSKPITFDDCVFFAYLVKLDAEYCHRKYSRSYFYEGLECNEIAWGS